MVRAEESWDARHFRFAGETNESQIGKKNPKTWPECKFSGFNTRMPGEFRLGDFFFLKYSLVLLWNFKRSRNLVDQNTWKPRKPAILKPLCLHLERIRNLVKFVQFES